MGTARTKPKRKDSSGVATFFIIGTLKINIIDVPMKGSGNVSHPGKCFAAKYNLSPVAVAPKKLIFHHCANGIRRTFPDFFQSVPKLFFKTR